MRTISAILLTTAQLLATNYEINLSYDHFRGQSEGSWNGNDGAYLSVNAGTMLDDCYGFQLGGSYGMYDWDGRTNLVFKNSKPPETEGFLTTGFWGTLCEYNAGVVYDRLFSRHWGIFDTNPSFDQIRFQGAMRSGCDEFGVWGTASLTTAHEKALGLPVSYRAISQISLFWTRFFSNGSLGSIWVGAPYRRSLMDHKKTAGEVLGGFFFRAPLFSCFMLDAHGTYMRGHKISGSRESRNYGANIAVGITYVFGDSPRGERSPYFGVANNSSFMVETSVND